LSVAGLTRVDITRLGPTRFAEGEAIALAGAIADSAAAVASPQVRLTISGGDRRRATGGAGLKLSRPQLSLRRRSSARASDALDELRTQLIE
jgi:hypothetical protein